MLPDNVPCFIGVIEWPDLEPDVILAPSAHEVRRAALDYFLTTDLDGALQFAFDFSVDLSHFLTDNPLPGDLTDVEALKDWHEALQEVTLQPVLSIFGAHSDTAEGIYAWDRVGEHPGFDPVARETPSAVTDPASSAHSPSRGGE